MPKLEEDLIDRLTLRPEVREKARALLRTVRSKTGPGTGYDIGDAKSGLPAICTYLASKR
jgi:transcription initiation factor TFIIIB Brf1 subunit/transcription initiation factor TFIIB